MNRKFPFRKRIKQFYFHLFHFLDKKTKQMLITFKEIQNYTNNPHGRYFLTLNLVQFKWLKIFLQLCKCIDIVFAKFRCSLHFFRTETFLTWCSNLQEVIGAFLALRFILEEQGLENSVIYWMWLFFLLITYWDLTTFPI